MWRAVPLKFSMGLVVANERSRVRDNPRPMTVRVSSRPSRSDAAAPGYLACRLRARFSSCFLAEEWLRLL
jgi:hypothetical protein